MSRSKQVFFICCVWPLLLITEICTDTYVTLRGTIANDALGRTWQQAAVMLRKVSLLTRHFSGLAEESHENSQSGYLVNYNKVFPVGAMKVRWGEWRHTSTYS